MSQMKKQKKTTGKNLNKMETSNLPDTQFKIMAISMLKELSENFNKEIISIKKDTKIIF